MELHLIGNAHIDPVWLWRWQQGYAEVRATFQSALDRMEEFPDYIFTSACGCYYKWIEDSEPEMFKQIQKRVAEGRWEIVGGMWIQPDCNIPSGESFARHILYTQQYFLEKFGRIATTGYNVDSFGHNGMIPQLLRKGGMDSYAFMRPGPHEKDLPGSLFNWFAPDGSFVTAFRIPISYGLWIMPEDRLPGDEDTPQIVAKLNATSAMANSEGFPFMFFYGVGNHGGGPTIKTLQLLEKERMDNPKLIYSSPTRYFKTIKHLVPGLPEVLDDLQHHASGCYSANSQIKKLNRMCEERLVTTEKIMSTAHVLTNTPYDSDEINRGWERVLFNHFHDIMAGCSIKSACQDAIEAYGYALDISARVANQAFQAISRRIDTSFGLPPVRSKESDWMVWEYENRGTPLVVFNPHSQSVTAPILINKELTGISDCSDIPVPLQKVRGEQTNTSDIYNTMFLADLPAMGYKVYKLFKESEKSVIMDNPASAIGNALENGLVRIEFDSSTGWIKSMLDKTADKSLLNGDGAVPVVIDETDSDTWAHGLFEFHNEIGRFSNAKLTVLENGPLRAVIRVTSFYGKSELRQDFRLYRNDPVVEVAVQFNCNERHRMFKLLFPTNVDLPKAVYEMPYGFISKDPNGQEEPHQGFVAAAGVNSFAIFGNGKYSAEMRSSDIYFTFARTPGYADHFGVRDDQMEYQDQGVQEFVYKIAFQDKTNISDYKRLSAKFIESPISIMETYHYGSLPTIMAGCEISTGDVLVTAFKRAEKLPGYIIRAVEISGNPVKSTTIDMVILNRSVTLDFAPQEIKTIYFPDDDNMPIEELGLVELPI